MCLSGKVLKNRNTSVHKLAATPRIRNSTLAGSKAMPTTKRHGSACPSLDIAIGEGISSRMP